MVEFLKIVGLDGKYISVIINLYWNPSAFVRVRNESSEDAKILWVQMNYSELQWTQLKYHGWQRKGIRTTSRRHNFQNFYFTGSQNDIYLIGGGTLFRRRTANKDKFLWRLHKLHRETQIDFCLPKVKFKNIKFNWFGNKTSWENVVWFTENVTTAVSYGIP